MPTARFKIEHGKRTTYGVIIGWPEDPRAAEAVVVTGETYANASQLTDALNARFGHIGGLAALGRNVTGEIADLADTLARSYR